MEQEEELNDDFYERKVIVVDPKQEPTRIDKFLMSKLVRISRNKVQNAIHSGAVTVNDKAVKPNFKVKHGHTITLLMPRHQEASEGVIPEDIPLDIVYEDDYLMVVNKPAGMVVHPGVGNRSGTLVNALAHYLQTDMPVMEGNKPTQAGLVHRIDKDTTGLLLVAKDDFTLSHLAKQFYHHTVHRRYVALVWGQPDEQQGTITGHIGRDTRFRFKQAVFPDGKLGKHAITHWRIIEPLYYVSLVECQLETGRTHQIRVHMKHIGHPLFNDAKYGGDRIRKGTVYTKYKNFVERLFSICPRQALHARELGFDHPKTGERMMFEQPLPDDMALVLDNWRRYVSDRQSKKAL